MTPGQKIRFAGEANEVPGMETGDIVVVLMQRDPDAPPEDDDEEEEVDLDADPDAPPKPKKEKPKKAAKREESKRGAKAAAKTAAASTTTTTTAATDESVKATFQRLRNGIDLVMEKKLTLVEALLGYRFSFKHLDGRILVVRAPVDHVVAPDEIMIVEGEGMPMYRNPTHRGDLYIKFSIVMPRAEDLKDRAVREALGKLLPPAPRLPSDVTEESEQHVAKKYSEEEAKAKARENEARQRAQAAYARDDEDDERGGGGAQCRQM